MRTIGVIPLAAVALGAHCPATPWDYEPVPEGGPRSEVYFDSGAVVQARLVDGEQVRGSLPCSFTPGHEELVVCEEALAPCGGPDGSRARIVPLTQIERLEFPESAAGKGAVLGGYAGMIGALAYGVDDDDVGLFYLSVFSGGLLGGLIALPFTDWITVAERSDAGKLTWVPKVPALIPRPGGSERFAATCARGNSLPTGDLIAVVEWGQTAYFTDIVRAWEVDTVNHRMISSATDDIRCRNERWDGPPTVAPYDAEREALTFTPTRGKARVYVYHTHDWPRENPMFDIAIDGESIGRVTYGAYLMVEVEPGPHRVTSPGARVGSVLLDAAADSAYFIGAWHKIGLSGPVLDRMERLNRIEGRSVIRAGRMLVSRTPTGTQGPYQDVRAIGLVDVPGLFGRRDPDGPPGLVPPAKIEPIPLHALPAADARIIGSVTAPDQLDAREYDYEALAAVAYEARDSAYLVRLRAPDVASYGWLVPPHAGTFHPLGNLVREGPAYLTQDWDGRLFASPGDTIASTRLERSEDLRDLVVKDVKEIEGALWLQIEIRALGRCETAMVRPTIVWGWIRAHASDGNPNAWFYSRGC